LHSKGVAIRIPVERRLVWETGVRGRDFQHSKVRTSAPLAMGLAVALAACALAQVNPFGDRRAKQPPDSVWGTMVLSNGESYEGWIYLTRGRMLKFFDAKKKENVEYALGQVSELTVRVTQLREEKEWRFKESASDEKVFTGKSYFRKDFVVTVVLPSGRKQELEVARGQPVYCLQKDGKVLKPLLQPFMQGPVGAAPEALVHIRRIVMHKPGEAPASLKGGLSEDAAKDKAGEMGKDAARQEGAAPAKDEAAPGGKGKKD